MNRVSKKTTAPAKAEGIATIAAVPRGERGLGQVPIIHPDLRKRRGYQPDFLDLPSGQPVPLPALTKKGAAAVVTLDDGSPEIKYHRFSVVLHKKRRLALFTASNVDWRPSMRAPGGKRPTRNQLTGILDDTPEQWVTDPRIPDDFQLPDLFYTADGGAFDKGHIVRRDDVCWGKTFDDIQKGNGDTFHTTNCSPQASAFNRSNKGEDNWGDLENLVQSETSAEKVVVFAGPVLASTDPLFQGRDHRGKVSIQIPLGFWKIIVATANGEPRAYGFVLQQSTPRGVSVRDIHVPKRWIRFMQPIAAIERLLDGHAKLDWLKSHDAFETATGKRIERGLSQKASPKKEKAAPQKEKASPKKASPARKGRAPKSD